MKQPILNKPQGTPDTKDYLSKLEDLIKRNKGRSTLTAYDTGANIPTVLPQGTPVRQSSGLEGGLSALPPVESQMRVNYPTMPEYNQGDGGVGEFLQQIRSLNEEAGYTSQPQTQTQNPIEIEKQTGLPYARTRTQDGGLLYSDGKVRYSDGSIREGGKLNPTKGVAWQSRADGSIGYNDGSVRRLATEEELSTQDNMSMDMSPTAYSETGAPYTPAPKKSSLWSSPRGTAWTSSKISGQKIGSDLITNVNQAKEGNVGDNFVGLAGLQRSLLGNRANTVTQNYGDPTSYGYHQGVDFAPDLEKVSDMSIALPWDLKIVDVGYDDGSGTGYGNSLVVQLPDGKMLKISHLQDAPMYQVGDVVGAGKYLGDFGSTGNSTGIHAHVEYYDENGQETDPSAFMESSRAVITPKSNSGMRTGSDFNSPFQSVLGAKTEKPTPEIPPAPTQGEFQGMNNLPETSNVGDILSSGIQKANPTGQYGLGLAYNLKGEKQKAADQVTGTLSRAATKVGGIVGAPLMKTNLTDLQRKNQSNPYAQAAGNTADVLGTSIGAPEMGLSELIAGGLTTFTKPAYAAENNLMTNKPKQNIFQRAQSYAGNVANKAGNEIDKFVDTAGQKAGQGIQSLKQGVEGLIEDNIFKKKDVSKMGGNKIGEDTGSDPNMSTPSLVEQKTANDIRDPFFKAGGTNFYKEFINPGITDKYKGSLGTGLFNDKFYQNPDNVANVFGNTYAGKEATDKYRSYMQTQYPIIPGHDNPTRKYKETFDGQEYEWEDVDPIYYENQYNQSVINSIPSVLTSSFSFQAPKTSKTASKVGSAPMSISAKASNLTTPVKSGSIPQAKGFTPSAKSNYSAPSNIFSAPSVSKPSISVSRPSSGSSGSSGSSRPSPAPVSAPSRPSTPSYSAPSKSSAPSYSPPKSSPSPKPAPTPAPKSSPKPQSKPSTNIFQQALKTISSWFK